MIGKGIAILGICALTAFVFYLTRSPHAFWILGTILMVTGFEIDFRK